MFLTGCGVTLLVWLLAGPISQLLAEPRLVDSLRLFSLEIPIFCLGQAHRQMLTGLGRFSQRAIASGGRWLARMVLIVVLLQLGFGMQGAFIGTIGASVVEFAIGRFYIRPPLLRLGRVNLTGLWEYSAPLFVAAICLRFYDRLDLFALKALGGSAEQAGYYSAAQRLAALPGGIMLSLSPLLMAALIRALRESDRQSAERIARYAMRGALWLLPLAGAGIGPAGEVVALVFGPRFQSSAPLLLPLMGSALAVVFLSICTSTLVAYSKPRVALWLTIPVVPIALASHLIVIPRLGPLGAAAVMLTVSASVALAGAFTVRRITGLPIPWPTLLRGLLVGAIAYTLGGLWPAPGWLVILKVCVLAPAAIGLLALLGEFSMGELAQARDYLRRPLQAAFGRVAPEV